MTGTNCQEEKLLAVERTEEYAKELITERNAIFCGYARLARRTYGHPKQPGAITMHEYTATVCATCWATAGWFVCEGDSDRMKKKRRHWFCLSCDHMYNGRDGSRNCSIRYGVEKKDVTLSRPFPYLKPPGRAGEVDAFFTSSRLTTNVVDDNMPFKVVEVETTYHMVVRIRKFIVQGNVEASMSLGGAWKESYNDTDGNADPRYNEQLKIVDVLNDTRCM